MLPDYDELESSSEEDEEDDDEETSNRLDPVKDELEVEEAILR